VLCLFGYSFFAHSSPLLPILDRETSPNAYYAQSPLLFWAIVAAGSRRFGGDPTLLESLTPGVMSLAMRWIQPRGTLIYVIQGLLILTSWPPPVSSLSSDITFTLSGLIVHYALQIGLHYPTLSQDSTRMKLNLDDKEIQQRTHLWTYCVIVCLAYVVLPV